MLKVFVRVLVAMSIGGLTLLGGAGIAAADDEDHTHETFVEEFGPVLIMVGGNPCTGDEMQRSITQGEVRGEIEIENGREHGEVTVRRTELLIDNGFEAKVVESQDAVIVDGEGEVAIELEVEAIHPETGDHFAVHVLGTLFISGDEVVGADVVEQIGPCELGG